MRPGWESFAELNVEKSSQHLLLFDVSKTGNCEPRCTGANSLETFKGPGPPPQYSPHLKIMGCEIDYFEDMFRESQFKCVHSGNLR